MFTIRNSYASNVQLTKCVAVVGLLVIAFQFVNRSDAAVVFDLAADWNDTNNPNGPWSYNGVDGLPLPVHRSDWDSQTRIEHFSSPQPAWTAQDLSRSVPGAFKSLGVAAGTIWNLDAPAGRVGMHGQPLFAGVTWTSPASGLATVTGGVWKMRKNIGRIIDWHLTVNGSTVTGGTLTEIDPFTSSIPFDIASGSGGPSVLNVPVMAGDVIGIEAGYPVAPFHSDFVGVDFSVSLEPSPTGLVFWTDPDGPSGSHVIKRSNADGSGVQTVVSGLRDPRGMTLDLLNQRMYWTDLGNGAIRASNLDGSGPIQSVVAIGGGGGGVALDIPNGKMYWTDGDNIPTPNGRIRRANLDGSAQETLVTGRAHPVGIDIDPVHGKVYWTELQTSFNGHGSIWSANLDGSNGPCRTTTTY